MILLFSGEKFIDGTTPELIMLVEIQAQIQGVLKCIGTIALDRPEMIPKLKEELTEAKQDLSERIKQVEQVIIPVSRNFNLKSLCYGLMVPGSKFKDFQLHAISF